VCTPVSRQPTYKEFFEYADKNLKHETVLLANTDVVFDTSLGLVDLKALATHQFAHVLSVRPPAYSAEYRQHFGRECDATPRCTIGLFDGWDLGGMSWDAYLFHSPLPRRINGEHLNHFMNTMGGENRAAYQLEVTAGLKLYNPCMHVHAFHWHCIGGNMHHTNDRVDTDSENLGGILPCWDCPGVAYPLGHNASASLCKDGKLERVKVTGAGGTRIGKVFRKRENVNICLKRGVNMTQEKLLQRWHNHIGSVSHCRAASDVNCVVVHHGSPDEHFTYQNPVYFDALY
jgi:hypothetical protein